MSEERSIETLSLDGGCICFDFINTVHSRTEESVYDYLVEYQDLLDWCRRMELLPKEHIQRLEEYVKNKPAEGEEALQEIKAYREMLYSFFSAVAEETTVEDSDLVKFNTLIAEALSRIRFTMNGKKPVPGWEEKEINLYEPLWRVGKSAYEILTEQPVERIKECEACGWVFLDKSKNRSRRWCNMQTCGSAHKARKYYHRKKKSKD